MGFIPAEVLTSCVALDKSLCMAVPLLLLVKMLGYSLISVDASSNLKAQICLQSTLLKAWLQVHQGQKQRGRDEASLIY